MSDQSSKISVVIPVFNGASCIRRALDSVLRQTYSNYEIILVDDGSSDSSAKILSEYTYRFPEKIFYFFKENEGPGKAIKY